MTQETVTAGGNAAKKVTDTQQENAASQDVLAEVAAAIPAVRFDEDKLAIPPELTSLTKTTKAMYLSLSDQEKEEAKRKAGEIDFSDRVKIINFGESNRKESQSAIRQLGQVTRTMDTGEAGELVLALRKHQERLGVGGLETRWWERFAAHIPGVNKMTNSLANYIDRVQKVGVHLDEIFEARAKEKDSLIELSESVKLIRDECISKGKKVAVDIAAAEIGLKRADSDFKELAAKYQGTDDHEKIRELEKAFLNLVSMDRRIAMLKMSRTSLFRAVRMSDTSENMIMSLVQQFSEDPIVKEMWELAIDEAIVTHKIKKGVGIIRDSRETMNKILSANASNFEETVRECVTQMGQVGVDPALFRAMIERTTRAQEAFVQGMKEARPKLQEQAKEFDKMFEELNEAQKKYAESISQLAA